MTNSVSVENQLIRPEDIMDELDIKKSKYYQILKKLGIKANKDNQNKSYLTEEQANRIRDYFLNNSNSSENSVDDNSALVKADDSNLAVSSDESSLEPQNIYVEPESPTSGFDMNKLMREAAELKARELAMPALVKRALADQMTEGDMPEDLKEKINLAREAANPKFTPAEVATGLLTQWRSNRSGN